MRSLIQNQIQKKQLKIRIAQALLCTTILFSFSSCAPVVKLVGMVIELPFRILGIAFKLIPVIVKVAPLALMFVDSDEELKEYYAFLPSQAPMVTLGDGTSVYRVELEEALQKKEFLGFLEKSRHKVLFLESEFPFEKKSIESAYRYFMDTGLTYAYQEELHDRISQEGKIEYV